MMLNLHSFDHYSMSTNPDYWRAWICTRGQPRWLYTFSSSTRIFTIRMVTSYDADEKGNLSKKNLEWLTLHLFSLFHSLSLYNNKTETPFLFLYFHVYKITGQVARLKSVDLQLILKLTIYGNSWTKSFFKILTDYKPKSWLCHKRCWGSESRTTHSELHWLQSGVQSVRTTGTI